MSLHTLPPEIFVQVLQCLPSSYFREDVDRLHVSKRWYDCAHPIMFRDLEFTASSLHRFTVEARTNRRLVSMLPHVKTMTTTLRGFDNWNSPRLLPEMSGINLDVLNDWTSQLNRDLAILARLLPRLTKLESVQLTALKERYDSRVGVQHRSYLDSAPTMAAMCTSNLTSLDVDVGGCYLSQGGSADDAVHHCEVYRLVPRGLRRLRVRAMMICPAILQILDPEKGFPPVLEDVIINLSLDNTPRVHTTYRYPGDCRGEAGHFWKLKMDMEAQATSLVKTLRNPRIVRVISQSRTGLQLQSFDAITGRRMVLSSPTPWDADGRFVEEGEPENSVRMLR